MNPHPLRLRRLPEPQREAVAWFLPGANPAAWLEELIRWPVPQSALKLFVVPGATPDAESEGLLVIPPAGSTTLAPERALALGAIEGRLFLPVDAALFPPVNAVEVRALCPAAITLFHPGIGLVTFEASDAENVWDLLAPAAPVPADWNQARAGAALSSRLAGVALVALPRADELFGEAPKDIGAEPPRALPPRPGEAASGPLAQAGRAVRGWSATAIKKVLSIFPARAARRTWVNAAMDWAAAKLAGVSREVEELRNRELHRLMHLLESDPERGLRHALPLGGLPGRGRTAPGTKLGARDLRLKPGGSGGEPVDPWDVPPDLRQKLLARYRELALREQQLGRFQRAAYIHAELLGDWSAAAAVLKEGRHFVEAAVIYRDRLNQARAAAECFEAGGLFREAVAIFEKERAFLELGDLHRRLGDEEAACVAYWLAVEDKTNAGDLTGAAVLIEQRLRLPDAALALLRKGWPATPQAAPCLTAEFALLGRLGRHSEARQRVAELGAETTPAPRTIELAEVLCSLHASYPDHDVRPLAADVARVKIAQRLADGDAAEARAGTRLLAQLAPEDRLLARDASRFLTARLEALARPTPPPLPPPPRRPGSGRVGSPEFVRKFRLPNGVSPLVAKRCGDHYLSVIRQGRDTSLLRGNWTGIVQAVGWTSAPECSRHVVPILDEHNHNPFVAFILTGPQPVRRRQVMQSTPQLPRPLRLDGPSWMPEGVAAVSMSGGQCWLLRSSAAGEFILEVREIGGRVVGSFGLTSLFVEIGEPVEQVSMLAMGTQVWMAFDSQLFLFECEVRPRHWRCEAPIVGLEPSAPLLARAVVARCAHGAAVFWADQPDQTVEMLAADLGAPLAAAVGNGSLVLLATVAGPGGFSGRVFDLDRRGVSSSADFSWEGAWPVALVATNLPNEFAIFTQDGEVTIMAVPVVK
jgi:tetratricopeptide (TPR) repeat protein